MPNSAATRLIARVADWCRAVLAFAAALVLAVTRSRRRALGASALVLGCALAVGLALGVWLASTPRVAQAAGGLEVSLEAERNEVCPGAQLKYTIRVQDASNSPQTGQTNIQLTDTLSGPMTFLDVDPPSPTCTGTVGTSDPVTCHFD